MMHHKDCAHIANCIECLESAHAVDTSTPGGTDDTCFCNFPFSLKIEFKKLKSHRKGRRIIRKVLITKSTEIEEFFWNNSRVRASH
jgi:hypothetical protein